MSFSIFLMTLEDKHPIGRFLLALADGLLGKNVSPAGRGVKGGPYGPISKKHVGRTGCQRRAVRAD